MNYYIDFEANAVTNEIIAIGCVSEDGSRRFKTLVRPTTKLDRKIKELTGIQQEDVDEAPDIAVAAILLFDFIYPYPQIYADRYASFADWVLDQCAATKHPDKFPTKQAQRFYCYSNHDKEFLQASVNSTDDLFAKAFLTQLQEYLVDVSKPIAACFGRKAINLRRAYLTMRMENDTSKQSHDPVEDAEMLRYCHQQSATYKLPEGTEIVKIERPNMRYGKKQPTREPRHMVLVRATRTEQDGTVTVRDFPNIYAAMSLCNGVKRTGKIAVADKILARATDKNPDSKYYGWHWQLIEDENFCLQ